MNYANPALIKLRNIFQKLGVLRPVVRTYRKYFNPAYEESFDKYTVSLVTPGSVVWDVGANTGYFSEKYAEQSGTDGKVLAFDPSPSCQEILNKKFKDSNNVEVIAVALSNYCGEEYFTWGEKADPTGSLGANQENLNSTSVSVVTGDEFFKQSSDSKPNYIKIDVEGYELEVLQGMVGLLGQAELKGLFIEVHFLELSKRGMSSAPNEIVSIIKNAGFSVSWTDPSHLVAKRGI